MEGRLAALGMTLTDVRVVRHEIGAIAEALGALGGDIALILTGAATSDLHDTAPEAVRKAGGTVARFGMPVDPGNLLFLGRLNTRPVIGLPGLRPLARAERCRLGAGAAGLWAGRVRERYCRNGCRRAFEGNPDPTAAARAQAALIRRVPARHRQKLA